MEFPHKIEVRLTEEEYRAAKRRADAIPCEVGVVLGHCWARWLEEQEQQDDTNTH